MWMLPLYLHVNKKSDNDDDSGSPIFVPLCVLCFQEQYFRFLLTFHVKRLPSEFFQPELQSILVISNFKGLSEILRDIRTSTYQICRIEEKLIRLTTFNKYMCNWTLELEIY